MNENQSTATAKGHLHKVIQALFDRASVHYYLLGIDRLYYSGMYEVHPEIEKHPLYAFSMREYLLELIHELDTLFQNGPLPFSDYSYRPRILKKIIKYEKRRLSRILSGRRSSRHYAPWEYIPKHLSDKELRKPYVALRLSLIKIKGLDYQLLLKEMQDNAFSGHYERESEYYPDQIILYLSLKKMLEACYLIYAGEMDFGHSVTE